MSKSSTHIKSRIIIPFVIAMLAIVISSLMSVSWLYSTSIEQSTRQKSLTVIDSLQSLIKSDAALLGGLLGLITINKEVATVWESNDRHELYEMMLPIYENLNKNYHVTHFYFHNPDRSVFLRVHAPNRFDDVIERKTLINAENIGKIVFGIEVGRFGHLVLRVVLPWRIDGQLVGYLEIGEEIGHIINKLSDINNVELVMLLNKELIDKNEWESFTSAHGKQGNWEQFPELVLVENTLHGKAVNIIEIVENLSQLSSSYLPIETASQLFHGGRHVIMDYSGVEVGELLYLLSTEKEALAKQKSIQYIMLSSAIIGTILLLVYFIYISKIEKSVDTARLNLQNEIENKKRIESELTKHKHELEKLVERRTDELNNVNIKLQKDIAARELAEAELQKHRAHLEEIVAERTAELDSSNKELESYSYSIAHDLRSPLRSIVSFSQILLEDTAEKLSDQEMDSLRRIISSGKYMANLIDDILEIARISREEMITTEINMSEICEKVMSRLIATDPRRHVQWKIQDEVVTYGDEQLLQVLMENLLGNAWKYTKNVENPTIEFGADYKQNDKVFYVKDNGVGFEQKYATKMFGIFQRLHSANEYSGTGIGLATVSRIVDRHGGKVWAKGDVNIGATIYFSLDKCMASESKAVS